MLSCGGKEEEEKQETTQEVVNAHEIYNCLGVALRSRQKTTALILLPISFVIHNTSNGRPLQEEDIIPQYGFKSGLQKSFRIGMSVEKIMESPSRGPYLTSCIIMDYTSCCISGHLSS